VRDFYTKNGSVSASNLLPLAQAIGDRLFMVPQEAEIRLASAHTPVYKFVLDHKGPGRLAIAAGLGMDVGDLGVAHADDLLYLFNNRFFAMPPAGSPTNAMIRFMVSLWTSFARTGRPGSTVFPMPDWPVFTEQSQRHLRLNSQPTLGERLMEERVQFWQSVPVNEPWRHVPRAGVCPSPPPTGVESY